MVQGPLFAFMIFYTVFYKVLSDSDVRIDNFKVIQSEDHIQTHSAKCHMSTQALITGSFFDFWQLIFWHVRIQIKINFS